MKRGIIEVITGCMFSGKSEELIRRIKRAKLQSRMFRFLNLHLIQDMMKGVLFHILVQK